jgi:hypothetical protein
MKSSNDDARILCVVLTLRQQTFHSWEIRLFTYVPPAREVDVGETYVCMYVWGGSKFKNTLFTFYM